MNTKKYTTFRITSQILSVVSAVSSIVAYVVFWFSNIDQIEINLTSKPILLLGDWGTYMCALNVLFALISACCITSKFKLWMRLCLKAMIMQAAFNICAMGYFFFFYPFSLTSSFSRTILDDRMKNLSAIARTLGVYPMDGSIALGLEKYVNMYVKLFCGLHLVGILSTMGNANIFNRTLKIDLEYKPKSAPKIDEGKQLGYNNEVSAFKLTSLRPIAVK